MRLHERIRQQRESLGLSKSETARRSGLSRQAYEPIEAGEAKPNIQTLVDIARALNTTVGALLGETALPATGTEGRL